MWNAGGRRHRFKALLSGRADGLRQEGISNELGVFSFNSIADFAAGRPASFSRTLSQPQRSGTVWNVATALAHRYAPSQFFNMLYGVRLEGDGFFQSPPKNAALEQALGVVTGAAPTRIHVSPRAGFSFTYNRDKDNGSGTNQKSGGSLLSQPGGRYSRRHRRVPRPSAPGNSCGRVRSDGLGRWDDSPLVRRRGGALR